MTEKAKTEVIAVVVVDKEPISKTVENSVDIFVHEELTLIKFEFDKIIDKDLLDSYAFAKELFSLASKKNYNNFRKDEYRRRLRFSANYIIKLVAEKRSKINHEPIE